MEQKLYFPSFSSFPIFFITLFTSFFLFLYLLNDSGILCVILMLYLFLLSVNKIFDAGCLLFTIVCGICICEVRVLYSILPHIFVQLSNGFIFILCHAFLLHCGFFIFLDFGFNKLKKNDQVQLMDLNLIIMITFPTTVAAIWTYASSILVDLSLVPFVALVLMFLCHQMAFRMYNSACGDSTLSTRYEVPITVSLVQLLAGVGTHIAISVSLLFRSSPQWTVIVMDQLMVFNAGILLVTLLPTSRLLINCGAISRRNMRLTSKLTGLVCYLMIIPLLHINGVHFHMARLMFLKMCVLVSGLVFVSRNGRKIWPVLLAIVVLIALFLWELPWGMQLLPNTTLFLERVYIGTILISVSALVALRSLALAARYSLKTSLTFELAFITLVTVFHLTESSLYWANLVPLVSVVMTKIFVTIVHLSLFSERLSVLTSAVIDSQLFLKLMIVLSHWSSGSHRLYIGVVAGLGGLIFGFVVSYSLRTKTEASLLICVLRFVSVCISLLMMRDSIILYIVFNVTHEQLLLQLTVVHCIAATAVLDSVINCRRDQRSFVTKPNIIRAVLALAAATLLINSYIAVGILLLGIYILQSSKGDKWDVMVELRNGCVLSGGCVLISLALARSTLLDSVLLACLITTFYLLHRLASQSSIRVLKRLFMRIWVVWLLLWLANLTFGTNDGLQYCLVIGMPVLLSLSVARRSGCLHDSLDSSGSVNNDRRVISRIRAVCVAQTIVGGLIQLRFQWWSPLAWTLPLSLLLLEKYPCTCDRKQLSSKHVNSLSLAVSTCGLFLLFSTIEESPLFTSAALQSAIDLSLQLDMVVTIKAWFELLLSCLLGICHLLMLLLSAFSVKSHNCVTASIVSNIDLCITMHTFTIPLSLGFLFCSSSISSAVLALLSFASGLRFLVL